MKRTFPSFRGVLALALVASACGSDATSPLDAPGERFRTVQVDGVDLLLQPEVRPIAPAGWTVETIGREGGSIAADGARLEIPAGALADSTSITMQGRTDPTWKYKFGPSGLQFLIPARLDVAVDPAALGIDPSRLRLVGSDDMGLEWEPVPGSGWDPARGVVSGPISHFSQYALCVE